MEILIVGVILVALMVYASTRIKKSAARAFESETIDADEFYIEKPEGFINPLRDESAEYAFEAYSKDFGTGDAENVYQAQAFITVSSDKNFAQICGETRKNARKVLSEEISNDEKI